MKSFARWRQLREDARLGRQNMDANTLVRAAENSIDQLQELISHDPRLRSLWYNMSSEIEKFKELVGNEPHPQTTLTPDQLSANAAYRPPSNVNPITPASENYLPTRLLKSNIPT